MSFRFDRFATLYLFSPLQRYSFGGQQSVPVLMYHSISDDAEAGVHPYYRTSTSPHQFASQMQYLSDNGYRTPSLSETIDQLKGRAVGDLKMVVITFDDGYSDFYREAFPVLTRFGLSATVYLPTSFIGDRPLQFKNRDCLTWAEVRELQKSGILFGSHTVTHPQLATLEATAVRGELANSKTAIEDKLGEAIDSFAYPYAFPEGDSSFVQMLRDALIESGYHNGVSTRIGTVRQQDDPYFLRRIPVNSLDDAALFEAKLHGNYDWLHKIQYASKLIKKYS
jgi:peptidoglycan/xylan/chitin deacetylase (PgdA/CDA1 family)